MSAVDAPPGVAMNALAQDQFRAPARVRKWTQRAFLFVLALAVLTMVLIARRQTGISSSMLLSIPLFCVMVAWMAVAVRSAKLRVLPGDLVWSLGPWLQFSAPATRFRQIESYADALVLKPKRGSPWVMAAGDWEDFGSLATTMRRNGFEVSPLKTLASFGVKAQSYGRAINCILWLDVGVALSLLTYVVL